MDTITRGDRQVHANGTLGGTRPAGIPLGGCLLVLLTAWLAPGVRAAFEDQTVPRLPGDSAASYAAAAVDANGDGHADLFLAEGPDVRLLLNDGAGNFTPAPAAALPALEGTFTTVTVLDVDRDGDADIFLGNAAGQNRLLVNNGAGTFTDETFARLPTRADATAGAAAADVDRDGDIDLVVANRHAQDRLLLNNGAGVFTEAGDAALPGDVGATSGVVAADLNADGRVDLFFVSEDGPPRLLLRLAGGVYTDASDASLPEGLPSALDAAVLDLDRDGAPDLLLAAGSNGFAALLNDGSGVFALASPLAAPLPPLHAVRIALADVDEDAIPDVILAAAGQDRILISTGEGTLTDQTAALLPADTERTFGIAAADLDGDLDADLLLARPQQQNRFLANQIAFPRVRLTATPASVEVGNPVAIAVQAFDEDGLASLGVTVDGTPVPLTDGQGTYTPAAVGTYTVVATAEDTTGATGTRQTSFAAVPNLVPVVNAGPDASAIRGQPFASSGSFEDPFDSAWTATVDYGDGTGAQALALAPDRTFQLEHTFADFGTFTVTVAVDDGDDVGTGTATVTVENQPPVVTAIPPQVVQAPLLFPVLNLDAYVDDPDHPDDQITWAAAGQTQLIVTIDGDRQATITYPEGTLTSEVITFTATDPLELEDSTSVTCTVTESTGDFARPVVTLAATPETNVVGAATLLTVTVTDDSAILTRGLTVDGNPVLLSAGGQGSFSSPTPGVFSAVATAMDAAGNTGEASLELRFQLPGDTTPPTAAITAPADDTLLAGPTDIVGTAADATLLRYLLEYSPKDEGAYVLFDEGTTSVTNGVLGVLDTTLLNDGLYDIRLTAEDASGNTATAWRQVRVEKTVKVGDVKFRVVDVTIPVAGLDISVYRGYDSRNKTKGAFGIGWTLDTSDITLQQSCPPAENWSIGRSGGFIPSYYFIENAAHYLTVRYPNQHVERFVMKINPESQQLFPIESATAYWTAAPGTYSSIVALANNDLWIVDPQPGPVTLLDGNFNDYNPTRFRITGRDNYAYTVGIDSGLESITDPAGNTLAFNASGINHSAGLGVVFTRDAQNRITRITDPAGGELTYTYDAYGDLVAFTNTEGGVMQYVYDADHNLIKIIDPRGNVLQSNEFDDEGRLRAIIGPDGTATTFDHDLGTNTEIVTDRLGNSTTYKYDAAGNIIETIDSEGGVHKATFDANGNRTSATDPLGNTTTFEYDAFNQMTRRVDPLGNEWNYTYDADGNVTGETDPEGNVKAWTYNASGNLLTLDDGAGGQVVQTYDAAGNLASFTDLSGNVHSMTVDGTGRLTSWTGPYGVPNTVQVNTMGRITKEQYVVDTPGGPETVTYDYTVDGSGNVTKVQGPHGAVTNIGYDEAGAYSSLGDAAGNTANLDYATSGRLSSVAFSGGNSIAYEYDAEGRPTRTASADGRVTERQYDSIGRPTYIKRPDGTVERHTYDLAGRVATTTDSYGQVSSFEYDKAGRATKVIHPLGAQFAMEYDGNSFLTATVDPTGIRTEFDRDAKGRATEVRYANGAAMGMAYDGEGNLVERTDGLGRKTTWTYDGTGQLAEVKDALNQTTAYERSIEGTLKKVIQANGAETTLEHDRLRRLTKQTLPLGQSETRTYDASGRIASRTDFAGQTATYLYDATGNLASREAEDGTDHAFTYSLAGKMLTATNEHGTWQFEYDAFGRYSRITEPGGRQVAYTYDVAGKVTRITTPQGNTDYAYDELGRLVSLVDPDGRTSTWTYDAASRLTAATHANGTTTAYTYDTRGMLASVTHRDALDAVLFSEIYTRDLNGRITRVQRHDGAQVDYVYNEVGWLTEETLTPAGGGAAQTTTVTYDAVGNRTQVIDAGGTHAVACDANGRLLSDGTYAYSYNANGNIIQRTGAGETLQFTYDGFDRLVGMTRTGGSGPSSIQYRYDPLGTMVGRVVDGVAETYLVDRVAPFYRVLEEYDAGGAIAARNVFGVGIEARVEGGSWSVLHADHLGSVRLRTGAAGAVQAAYEFDAFGNLRSGSADSNPYRFAGERWEAGLGAVNLRARFYWPGAGRFLQMDAEAPDIDAPQTLHRYLYCANDPVNCVDPSGRQFSLMGMMGALAALNSLMNIYWKLNVSMMFILFAVCGGMEVFKFPGANDGNMKHRAGVTFMGF
ncbi:MAG: VCBS repeat-containing protein, partial [Lentisphaeria bacterium]|nr:VCBS repeat-containing protein [Lentisphaeria bacterium]